DLAEARQAALNVQEAVAVHTADVTGAEPIVFDDLLSFLRVLQIPREDIGAFEPDHAALVDAERLISLRIRNAHCHACQKLPDAAWPVARKNEAAILFRDRFGIGQVDIAGWGGLRKAVALVYLL